MTRWDAFGLVLLAAAGGLLFATPASGTRDGVRPAPGLDAGAVRLASAAAARADARHDHFDALVGSLAAGVGGEVPESLRAPLEEIRSARAEERKRTGGSAAHAVERAIVAAARELGRAEREPEVTPLVAGSEASRFAAVTVIVSAGIAWLMGARARATPRISPSRRACQLVDPVPDVRDEPAPYGKILEIVPVSD